MYMQPPCKAGIVQNEGVLPCLSYSATAAAQLLRALSHENVPHFTERSRFLGEISKLPPSDYIMLYGTAS